ncbi:MAG: hypothetical protein IKG42_04640 [Clostridia bacterium]|nr:hypothetical protein [Clostridia bacterium]
MRYTSKIKFNLTVVLICAILFILLGIYGYIKSINEKNYAEVTTTEEVPG